MTSSGKKGRNTLTLFVVDAFTNKPFKGNSAAICLLPSQGTVSKETKQKIAAEMNLSETAFVTTKSAKDAHDNASSFGLEWFTPTCEVNLCGHATLASAAVLFLALGNKSEVIEFETLSGTLKARLCSDNKIEIDLPAYNYTSVKGKFDNLIKAVVGTLPVVDVVLSESKKLLIRLADSVSRQELESFRTNERDLLSASSEVVGVIVTLKVSDKSDCKDDDLMQYDFISRYFAPWLGILEDPVTGSAHSVLGPYWAKILQKNTLYARQCSSRGGDLNVQLVSDRVIIHGNATIVIQGQISF